MKLQVLSTTQIAGSTGNEYTVLFKGGGIWSCTCLDYKYRHKRKGGYCKHILQVQREGTVKSQRRNSAKHKIGRQYAEVILSKIMPIIQVCCEKVEVCGSYRREHAKIGDLDIVVVATVDMFAKIADGFKKLKAEKLMQGDVKMAYVLSGVQIDVNRVPAESWGSALCHFTGSMAENMRLRKLAKKKGFSLSQYGFTLIGTCHLQKMATEKEVYAFLGEKIVHPTNR